MERSAFAFFRSQIVPQAMHFKSGNSVSIFQLSLASHRRSADKSLHSHALPLNLALSLLRVRRVTSLRILASRVDFDTPCRRPSRCHQLKCKSLRLNYSVRDECVCVCVCVSWVRLPSNSFSLSLSLSLVPSFPRSLQLSLAAARALEYQLQCIRLSSHVHTNDIHETTRKHIQKSRASPGF